MNSSSRLNPTDIAMLSRAVEIARLGLANVAPNPHVGAVIAVGDKIIGEGFHRQWGGPHAEVNAFRSVSPDDIPLLSQATIYVTLEPCAHYGKTPPCARLIIEKGVKRVVVGAVDPNPKVDGGGIAMIRQAGIEVVIADGEIARRCRELDQVFMTSFLLKRPYITLKWAQSADGFMADKAGRPVRFSTPLTSTLVHQLRSRRHAILTTSSTVIADNPRLDTRLWSAGNDPVKVVIDRHWATSPDALIYTSGRQPLVMFTSKNNREGCTLINSGTTPGQIIEELNRLKISSLLVETGPTMLTEFINAGLWDEIRIEQAPFTLGDNGGKTAPLPPTLPASAESVDGRTIFIIKKDTLTFPTE